MSTFLGVAAVVAVASILVRGRKDLAVIAAVSGELVALIVGLQVLYLLTQAERYRFVIEDHAQTRLRRGQWVRTFLIGRLLNSAIAQGGNVYRGAALSRSNDIKVKQYISSLAGYSWMTLVVSLVIASTYSFELIRAQRISGALGLLAVTLAVAAAPFFVGAVAGLLPREMLERRTIRAMADVVELMQRSGRNPRLLIAFLLQSTLAFALGAGIVSVAFRMAGLAIPVGLAAAYLAFLQVSNVIVVTPGNIGIQELGFVALSGLVGTDAVEESVVASFMIRASGLLAILVSVGAAELWWRIWRNRRSSDEIETDPGQKE